MRRVCGVEHGARLEHGASDGEEPVRDASDGPWVSVSALAEAADGADAAALEDAPSGGLAEAAGLAGGGGACPRFEDPFPGEAGAEFEELRVVAPESPAQAAGADSADTHVPGGTASNPTAEPNRKALDELDRPAGIGRPGNYVKRKGAADGPPPPGRTGREKPAQKLR